MASAAAAIAGAGFVVAGFVVTGFVGAGLVAFCLSGGGAFAAGFTAAAAADFVATLSDLLITLPDTTTGGIHPVHGNAMYHKNRVTSRQPRKNLWLAGLQRQHRLFAGFVFPLVGIIGRGALAGNIRPGFG